MDDMDEIQNRARRVEGVGMYMIALMRSSSSPHNT